MTTKTSMVNFTLGAAAFACVFAACKPAGVEGSAVLETGGTPADWRVAAMLSASGDLRVDRVAPGSTGVVTGTGTTTATGTPGSAVTDATRLASVVLELAQAPDGATSDANLSATRYMDLTAGGGEVRVNLLMRMRDNRLCYANTVQLSGQSEAVTCKEAADSVATGTPVDNPTQRRTELAAACERIAATRVAPTQQIFLARYDAAQEACFCLTGRERELRYADYQTRERDVRLFEADCRRDPASVGPIIGIGTGTSTGTGTGIGTSTGTGIGSGVLTGLSAGLVVAPTADVVIVCRDLVTRSCNDAGRSGVVVEEYDGCRCGDVLQRYDDYRGRADRFAAECQEKAFAATLRPEGTSIRAVCP